ncbi:hypothetical protein FC650_13515 [Vibrio natriegens]|nr:hypothetical protein [Vibrio natriegens]
MCAVNKPASSKSIAFLLSTDLVIIVVAGFHKGAFCDRPLKGKVYSPILLPQRKRTNSTELVTDIYTRVCFIKQNFGEHLWQPHTSTHNQVISLKQF